jgi:predicted dithiol-disulfide oxidoreductase (DUF899 family)
MALPPIVDRATWVAARKALLVEEKALTRRRDALNASRRRLPMVRIEHDYQFTGPDGPVPFRDLFAGCRQLIVVHFMFDPRWEAGCSSCTAGADERSAGLLDHLRARDTALATVSRAPYKKLARYKAERGWTFPWYSSFGSAFNYDFQVTLDETVRPIEYNYRTKDEHAAAGTIEYVAGDQPREMPGVGCFLHDGGAIFHTYSTFARGDDTLGSAYSYLDLTALGRQEAWEEPQGRATRARDATPDFSA